MKIFLLIGFLDILKKEFKILQKRFYQKFWNVICFKNIQASGTNNFY